MEGTQDSGTGPFRPLVDVIIDVDGHRLGVRALLDSGADITTVPTQVVTDLVGKTFDELGGVQNEMVGIGTATVPTRIIPAAVIYMGRQFASHIQVGDIGRVVLGREDFMRMFNVRIYWNKPRGLFYVEPAAATTARTPKTAAAKPNSTVRPKRKRR